MSTYKRHFHSMVQTVIASSLPIFLQIEGIITSKLEEIGAQGQSADGLAFIAILLACRAVVKVVYEYFSKKK